MKKVILLLLLMIFNFNGIMNDSYAEYSHISSETFDFKLYLQKKKSIMNLSEELSMNEMMNVVHDEMIIDKMRIEKYKELLAVLETGGHSQPYNIKNKYGYAGKYQFGKSALRTLYNSKLIQYNVDKHGQQIFLKDSILQENALNALILYNFNYAKKKNLLKYVGKKINGVTITLEGILAGSHLVGPVAVCHFLKNKGSLEDFYIKGQKFSKYDGNGVSVLDYIKKFENV